MCFVDFPIARHVKMKEDLSRYIDLWTIEMVHCHANIMCINRDNSEHSCHCRRDGGHELLEMLGLQGDSSKFATDHTWLIGMVNSYALL